MNLRKLASVLFRNPRQPFSIHRHSTSSRRSHWFAGQNTRLLLFLGSGVCIFSSAAAFLSQEKPNQDSCSSASSYAKLELISKLSELRSESKTASDYKATEKLSELGVASKSTRFNVLDWFLLPEVTHCDAILSEEDEEKIDRGERWRNLWNRDKNERKLLFHQSQPNEQLTRYLHRLAKSSNDTKNKKKRVLVPLCGKTKDMVYLASNGFDADGVEIVDTAIQELAEDEEFVWDRIVSTSDFIEYKKRFSTGDLSIFQGDFLLFDKLQGEEEIYDLGFDRASLVAMQPVLREKYAEVMSKLCKEQLLVTLEYPQEQKQGPPFSVSREEVKRLYEKDYEIELLERNYLLDKYTRWKDQGVTEAYVNVFWLKKRR